MNTNNTNNKGTSPKPITNIREECVCLDKRFCGKCHPMCKKCFPDQQKLIEHIKGRKKELEDMGEGYVSDEYNAIDVLDDILSYLERGANDK